LTEARSADADAFAIFCVAFGSVECCGRQFSRGEFFLLPAALSRSPIAPVGGEATVLRTSIPT
jgi:hypothetical protein